jgi:hypothetical protein
MATAPFPAVFSSPPGPTKSRYEPIHKNRPAGTNPGRAHCGKFQPRFSALQQLRHRVAECFQIDIRRAGRRCVRIVAQRFDVRVPAGAENFRRRLFVRIREHLALILVFVRQQQIGILLRLPQTLRGGRVTLRDRREG